MNNSHSRWPELKYVGVLVAIVATFALVWRGSHRDVDFCRTALRELVRGKLSAASRVDWERLQALGVPVGETYAQLAKPEEQEAYRKGFLMGFAKGFQSSGARPGEFVNWRVHARTGETVTVAADYRKTRDTLLLTIPASGPKKLVGIQWL